MAGLEALWQQLETEVSRSVSVSEVTAPPWAAAFAEAHHAELAYRFADAARAIEVARAAAPDQESRHAVEIVACRADVRRGTLDVVREALARARELAAGTQEDPPNWRRVMHLIGVACIRLGQLDAAERALAAVLELSLADPGRIWVLDSFAQVLIGQGAWNEALRIMETLVQLRAASADRTGVAITAGSLARLQSELGDHARAAETARAAFDQLPTDSSVWSRVRLQSLVTTARVEQGATADEIHAEAVRLEELLAGTGSEHHYLKGYAALALARVAALRSSFTSANEWLEIARSELTLPSQVTLLRYHEALLDPARLDDAQWQGGFEATVRSGDMVTEGEVRVRLASVERAQGEERSKAMDLAYERALASNNPLWMRWVDDTASRLAPDRHAASVARRFSGWSPSEIEQTRREEVTIVFSDLVSFTARSLELSPEEVMSTVRGLFELSVPSMMRHGVSPITYMGDGLLAIARGERHAARGFAFAQDLVSRASRMSLARRAIGDAWGLDLRAGLASGPVILGALGSLMKLDFAAIGLTTNLAARLQSAAAPGEVVCSAVTLAAAGVSLPLERLNLKGFEKLGPVEVGRTRPT